MKIKNIIKKLICVAGSILLGLNAVACEENDNDQNNNVKTESDVVTIPILLRSEPDSGDSTYTELIEGFNREYSGQYQLDVTLISETEEGYRTRLKELNAIDELPTIITDAAFGSDFLAIMEENDRYYGLYPISDGLYSSAGMFYNNDILTKCGISSYPNTWDEFFLDCEIIKAAGYTPLALHGGGDYWSALLIATAYMTRNEDGAAFLKEALPESFDNEAFKDMLSCVDRLYDYTYEDALNISHDQSLDRFMAGETAMIPGGYWMIPQMEASTLNVGFSTFCQGTMLVDSRMSAWAIVKSEDDAVLQGAQLFMEYRQDKTTDNQKSQSSIAKKFQAEYDSHTGEFPNYQLQWQDKIIKEDFDTLMPALIKNDITAEAFVEMLSMTNN